ncbi:hypothetical protein [Nibricoccus aquaticus]|uniref:hypothetical protein n=1 Tax=Nibricoccus aquaticus TaxID=2576891 RepID=UPI0010FF5B12|nr:hypothetical protein [Nibricoccus aquaticus]
MSSTPEKITKIEAARRQLKHALELYFEHGDPLIVYVLASAAHQVVHDLLEHAGKTSVFFGSEVIKPEHRNSVATFLRKPYSFTKHADRKGDPDAVLDFEPRLAEHWLFATVFGIKDLGLEPTDLEASFVWWWTILYPDTVSDASPVKAIVSKRTPEQINEIREKGRRGWPQVYAATMKQGRSVSGLEIKWKLQSGA